MIRFFLIVILFISCKPVQLLSLPKPTTTAPGGNEFYKQLSSLNRDERESMVVKEILNGNIPSFLKHLVPVHIKWTDSLTKKTIHATYFVTPDYLSIGNNNDFARMPMSPLSAQIIADSLHCFLPTKKIVDDIYWQASIKLEPMPMFAFRDSTITFYQHHLMIEGQRKSRKGLIAGIKKDIVISAKISSDPKPNRVAIYGWHKLDGKPIQPLYTGHVNWYVDYSHGVRLIYRMIIIDGKKYDYTEVLKDEKLKKLLCDEADCSFLHY